jgi:hypothetical protein
VSDPSARRVATPALIAVVVGAVALAGGTVAVLAGWLLIVDDDPSATAKAPVTASSDAEGWAPWATNDDGTPVRWDPCRPIELVIDPDGTPPGVAEDLAAAVDDVADVSGLELRIGAEVDERPSGDRAAYQPERYGERWAPVLIAAAGPGERGLPLRSTDRAIAAPVAVGRQGAQVFVSGQIVLNRDRDDVTPGDGDRASSWGAILRHELGHLLGLDHVDDEEQIMHAHPVPGEVELGDGDRRGLEALGRGGCVDVPAPGPLDVDLTR